LPRLLARFHQQHPGVKLIAESANTRAIARRLLEGRLDIALVEGPVSHERISVLPWREDELVVIAPASHPLVHKRRVRASDLANEPFILREPGSGTRVAAADQLALGYIAVVPLRTRAFRRALTELRLAGRAPSAAAAAFRTAMSTVRA